MKKVLSLALTISIASLLPAENQKPEEAVVLGALDTVVKSEEYASGADVMDFVTSAYGGHGYYETGGWDDPCPALSAYQSTLPPAWMRNEFVRPIHGKITSAYGYRQKYGRMHYGIDLALDTGDTIKAALPGVVDRVGYDMRGYGHYVIIKHDGHVETRYGHLQKPLARVGQRVEAAEPVALGGDSGNSTGPHLHFEIRHMGTPVNPISLF